MIFNESHGLVTIVLVQCSEDQWHQEFFLSTMATVAGLQPRWTSSDILNVHLRITWDKARIDYRHKFCIVINGNSCPIYECDNSTSCLLDLIDWIKSLPGTDRSVTDMTPKATSHNFTDLSRDCPYTFLGVIRSWFS